MTALLFTDPEAAAKTWLKTHPLLTDPAIEGYTLASGTAARIFFGIPTGSPAYPLVVIRRVGGGPARGQAPVDLAMLQLDCWGGSKAVAADVARRCVQAWQTAENVHLDPDTLLCGATVESVIWLPDPDDDRPRYVVTVQVTVMATP